MSRLFIADRFRSLLQHWAEQSFLGYLTAILMYVSIVAISYAFGFLTYNPAAAIICLTIFAAPIALLLLFLTLTAAMRARRWRQLTLLVSEGGATHNLFHSFPKQFNDEFRKHYNEASSSIAWGALVLGECLYLAFYFWDLVIDYDRSSNTLVVRIVVGTLILIVLLLPRGVRAKYLQELHSFIIAVAGVGVVIIIYLLRNGLNVGLSGVILVLMFNFGFLRLLFIPALVSGLIICLAYNCAAIVGRLDPLILIANNCFLIAAIIAGSSVTYLLEGLFRSQFLTEKELKRDRETLAQQNQNDRRYLAWLRQLAEFLRHEVRQPVAQINSSIEVAQFACKDNDDVAPYLATAALGSQQVWNLIERASQATDAEAFVRQGQPQWTDLAHLLTEQVDAFRQSNCGVDVRLQSPRLVRIYADPTLIKEAVGNLLGNAASFADDESTIEVTLKADPMHATIGVTNKGPPIEGDSETLFGPFASTRAGPSSEHQGLGLFLVRLIAEQHGGTASITNLEDGSGVQATVVMPLQRRWTGLEA
jgi:signal transduction histidine kinase